MVNENINIRVIANLERLLTRKNKLRKMQNQTLTRGVKKLSEDEKRQFLIEFKKV